MVHIENKTYNIDEYGFLLEDAQSLIDSEELYQEKLKEEIRNLVGGWSDE